MAGYKEIAKLLQQHFNSGEYPEGKYPSLRKIAADMGCSYLTAVRAMRFLKDQNADSVGHRFPLIAMITAHWRFSNWHRAIREVTMELGGQVRFITYSSVIDPVITQTLNEKFDLIFLNCPVEPGTPLFNVVQKNKDHVIVLESMGLPRFGIRCMDGAPEETVITIMKDLAKHGIRHIDMIGRAPNDNAPALRQAVWEKGLKLINGYGEFFGYPHANFNEESKETYMAVKDRFEKFPEAVFCLSPACAQGLYHLLGERGLVPGKDISVFSFGDVDIAEMMNPALATVLDSGMKEMVKKAISEYVLKKFSKTMLFELTEKNYTKGCSLVPFQQK